MSDLVKRLRAVIEPAWQGTRAGVQPSPLCQEVAARIEALREENERLREMLTWMVNNIQEWCKAVGRDSSWDSWDHHYKAFAYGGLEKARAALAPQGDGG